MQLIERTEAFAMEPPSAEQWAAELWSGWTGPDGSSWSFDAIAGITIGATTRDFTAHLPANRHDLRYRVIRRLRAFGKVTFDEGDALRLLADREHLRMLRDAVAGLPFYVRGYALANAQIRYVSLRRYAGYAAMPRMSERYIARELTQ